MYLCVQNLQIPFCYTQGNLIIHLDYFILLKTHITLPLTVLSPFYVRSKLILSKWYFLRNKFHFNYSSNYFIAFCVQIFFPVFKLRSVYTRCVCNTMWFFMVTKLIFERADLKPELTTLAVPSKRYKLLLLLRSPLTSCQTKHKPTSKIIRRKILLFCFSEGKR